MSRCLGKTVFPVAGMVCRGALGRLCSVWLGRCVAVPWEDRVPCGWDGVLRYLGKTVIPVAGMVCCGALGRL